MKTLLFLLAFLGACGGALYSPIIGIVGYMMGYQIAPDNQWWGESISHWGIRYAYMLALLTAISVGIHHRKLRYGGRLLVGHEWLLILFVGVMWLSTIIGFPLEGDVNLGDYPPLKLTKVVFFCLMMTHVVTTPKGLSIMCWAFVAGALFWGCQAFTAGASGFTGRLDTIGGPDFRDTNRLAGYLVATLPIIGVQFMRSGWPGKLLCLASGVMATNAVILTRSRGAVVGTAVVLVVALMTAPKALRKAVFMAIVLAALGAYALTDATFWVRASTTTASEEERDRSAQSRIEIWQGSLDMLKDHWYGVGAGNFQAFIGKYSPQNPRRDAHNTYVRCYSELGIHGIALFLLIAGSALRLIWDVRRRAITLPNPLGKDCVLMAYGAGLSLTALLIVGLTGTLLYIESLWWFLALPVCLERALVNVTSEAESLVPAPAVRGSSGRAQPPEGPSPATGALNAVRRSPPGGS